MVALKDVGQPPGCTWAWVLGDVGQSLGRGRRRSEKESHKVMVMAGVGVRVTKRRPVMVVVMVDVRHGYVVVL